MTKTNILLAVVVLLLGYAMCKNLKKTSASSGSEPTAATQPAEEPKGPAGWKGAYVIEGNNPDTAYTLQIHQPPRYVNVPWQEVGKPNTSRRAFMSTNYWYPKMAYQPSDTLVHKAFLGKWLKFREDQTFDIIQDGKVLETGHWAYDDDKKLAYISCKDPYFNNIWSVQERGFRMVWRGDNPINHTGIQVRMDNAATMTN